jgi:hypothetical protein
MIALHGRLDEARRVVGGSLEMILTEADGYLRAAGVAPKLAHRLASGGGLRGCWSGMPLNSCPDQLAQFVLVHSTHSS